MPNLKTDGIKEMFKKKKNEKKERNLSIELNRCDKVWSLFEAEKKEDRSKSPVWILTPLNEHLSTKAASVCSLEF